MQDKIHNILSRYEQIQERVAQPEVAGNPALSTPLLKEAKELLLLVGAGRAYLKACEELTGAKEMLRSTDTEMREMAEAEIAELTARIAEIEDELRTLLLPKDPADERNAILEIRAGTGGEEAALFAADLYRMYSRFADLRRWKVEVVSTSEAEAGGIKEIVVEVRGDEVYGHLKWESGVHRVQRVPVTEA